MLDGYSITSCICEYPRSLVLTVVSIFNAEPRERERTALAVSQEHRMKSKRDVRKDAAIVLKSDSRSLTLALNAMMEHLWILHWNLFSLSARLHLVSSSRNKQMEHMQMITNVVIRRAHSLALFRIQEQRRKSMRSTRVNRWISGTDKSIDISQDRELFPPFSARLPPTGLSPEKC